MSPTLMIVAFWLFFAATHIALSSVKLRPRIVGVIGGGGFLGMYSLVAFATFVPMVSTYFGNKHSGPILGSIAAASNRGRTHLRVDAYLPRRRPWRQQREDEHRGRNRAAP
jgi:hypothetical protein